MTTTSSAATLLAITLFGAVGCASNASAPRARSTSSSASDPGPEELARREKIEALSRMEPTQVPPGERAAYFESLRYLRRGSGAHSPASPEPSEPQPDSIRKMLGLLQLVAGSDPPLAARIREWLLERTNDFARAYALEGAKVLASPSTSPWHQAERAWEGWVMSQLPTFTEPEAAIVARQMSPYSPHGAATPFPELDRFTIGLAIADLWVREGHPKIERGMDAYESVLCTVNESYGKLSSYCDRGWWYRFAMATDADAHRLARAVLARKDPALTATVSLGIGRSPRTLAVLHEFEEDAATWRAALLAISRVEDATWLRDWLVPELRRVWQSQPSWRGVMLYALAQASGEWPDEVPDGIAGFTHFERDFHGLASHSDVESFLDQSPRALELLRWILPVRDKGWSVVDVMLPRLDAYFALPAGVPPSSPRGPGLARSIGHLCHREHDLAGMEKLRAYFQKRAPSRPGDPLNTLMDSFTPKVCGARR